MPSFLLNPGFAIAGLALLSVPIIIHLLNRRRFRTVNWAAMDYLLQAVRRNRRRMRFESWLLLAVRCLVICLAAFALARPMGCSNSVLARAAGREAGLHVIIIDDSGSMNYRADREESQTHFEAAKLLATSLLERLDGGAEQVVVLRASAPASDLIGAPSFDTGSAAEAVRNLQPTDRATDLVGAFDRAIAVAADASPSQPKTLYVLTDGTAAALTSESVSSERLIEAAGQLEAEYTILWHEFAEPGQSNLAVTRLAPADPLVRRGFETSFQANLDRYGGTPGERSLIWRVDGAQRGLPQTVTTDQQRQPVLTGDVALQEALADGQAHVVAAQISGTPDRLPVDDSRRQVIAQVRSMPVLVVEGRRSGGALGGSGAFLSVALAPAGENDYIDVDVISDLDLPGRTIDGYRAVVLAGIGNVSEPVADSLQRYVRDGGALVLWLGEAVRADNYNRVLGARSLLPGELVQRVSAGNEGAFAFDFDPQSVHPYLEAFRNIQRSGLEAPSVLQYWEIEPDEELAPSPILRYLPGDDDREGNLAVAVHAIGQGRVTTVTTAAGDPEWTLLPLRENFPAFVHELLVHTVGEASGGDAWATLEVGQSLSVPPSVAAGGGTPVLNNPDGEAIPLRRVVRPNGSAAWESDALDQVGQYQLTVATTQRPVVVNFPATESDVQPLSESALRAALGNIEISMLGDTLPDMGSFAESDRADFGWSILAIVLGLAAFEAFLAMWFGHGGRRNG